MKIPVAWVLAAVSGWGSMAAAGDISFSGFGTAGFAQSNQAFNYQRFVDKQGTFKRDSVLGVQVDAKLNDEFGFTLQGKVAPSIRNDKDIDATITWAFLSWRPTNDWLLRAGRLRVPLYLNSENMDVGATFDFARLPTEVYSTAQTTDGDGLFVSKTWSLEASELTLLGYWGSTKTHYRYYRRDEIPPLPSGSYCIPVTMKARGLVLTLQRGDDTYRLGFHDTQTRITDGSSMPETFPYVSIMPGIGYYQTSNLIPGPGVPAETEIQSRVFTLGADMALGHGFRGMGEYVRRQVPKVASGPDSQAAYLALLKSIGAWTPYLSVARLKSMPRTLDLYNRVNGNTVPAFIPGAAQFNASQRAGADGIMAWDQTTWAFGTSYRLTPTSKLKVEWARTQVGDVSSFIDSPPGGESRKKSVNVFSISYNVVF